MDLPSASPATNGSLKRTNSISQTSENSQTASDYIASQLRLEADAREALPYQFDTCTKPLGPLRQSVFACLTCTPPPATVHQQFTPAGVCYSCSISCHGEHNLVELFTKRDFVCDCGTTRLANSGTPCSLRINAATGRKGDVRGEEARQGNKYDQNYKGKFCGCGEDYDPEKEKGTMFQCLGLGTVENGGCGEDWWHPECLIGLPRQQHGVKLKVEPKLEQNGSLEAVKEETEEGNNAAAAATNGTDGHEHEHTDEEPPLPAGFPGEDDFDHFICYKCVNVCPWIKQYAGTPGFLPALPATPSAPAINGHVTIETEDASSTTAAESKKRKAEDDGEEAQDVKKARASPAEESTTNGHVNTGLQSNGTTTPAPNGQSAPAGNADVDNAPAMPKHSTLPPAPSGNISLFLTEDFRDHFCRCAECFPRLAKHPQLLEEEDAYEPPVSESDAGDNASAAGRSVNSGSILERGEAALSSMDRVRAIEGVMAYNHVRDKVKDFLKPFAESGQAVGAEDIKAYFAKLRGDEQAGNGAEDGEGGVGGDHRREQGGY